MEENTQENMAQAQPQGAPQMTMGNMETGHEEKKTNGALIGSLIVIIILIVGGVYFWTTRMMNDDTTLQDDPYYQESTSTTPEVQAYNELENIEQDLSSMEASVDLNLDIENVQ